MSEIGSPSRCLRGDCIRIDISGKFCAGRGLLELGPAKVEVEVVEYGAER